MKTMQKRELYIIVPYKNVKKYVQKFVQSIEQIMNNESVQLLLINDHSSDKSEIFLNEYFQCNSQVKFIDSNKYGVSAARNVGLLYLYKSTSELSDIWVIFCDFDDQVSRFLFSTLSKLANVNDYDYILFGYSSKVSELTTSSEDKINQFRCSNLNIRAIAGPFLENGIMYNLNSPWGRLIKLNFLKKNNLLFDEKLSFREDLLFNIRALNCNPKVGILSKVYYHYYINTDSVVHNYIANTLEQNKIAFKYFSEILQNSFIINSDYLKQEFLYIMFTQSNFVYVFPSGGTNNNYFKAKERFQKLRKSTDYQQLFVSRFSSRLVHNKEKIIYFLSKYNLFIILYILMYVKNLFKGNKND